MGFESAPKRQTARPIAFEVLDKERLNTTEPGFGLDRNDGSTLGACNSGEIARPANRRASGTKGPT